MENKDVKLVFLLEEQSMKEFLEVLLSRILPGVDFIAIPHEGKSDLKKSIPKKLAGWNEKNVKFIIIQDNDGKDCIQVKSELLKLCEGYGRDVLIRIPCQELEAWYWGDLEAVSKAYDKDITSFCKKKKYRNPDVISNPKEELKKIIPQHQQISGARKIAENMDVERNTSYSFRVNGKPPVPYISPGCVR